MDRNTTACEETSCGPNTYGLPNENSSTMRTTLFIFVFIFLDQLTSLRDTTSPEKQHCFDPNSPPIIEEVVVILISVNHTVIEPGVSLKNNMVLQRALP